MTRALCVPGVCGAARCGDGFVDVNAPGGAEQCDDANMVDKAGAARRPAPARRRRQRCSRGWCW